MNIVVATDDVRIAQGDDLKNFQVTAPGAMADTVIDGALRAKGLGAVEGGNAFIDPVALTSLVGAAATEEWLKHFAAMIDYAAGKGWIAANGFIQAHIEHTGG